jgi:hypothetical protein
LAVSSEDKFMVDSADEGGISDKVGCCFSGEETEVDVSPLEMEVHLGLSPEINDEC